MTLEEQAIVDAIWGEDAVEITKETLDGIFAMAELAAQCVLEGKVFFVPETDTLHQSLDKLSVWQYNVCLK